MQSNDRRQRSDTASQHCLLLLAVVEQHPSGIDTNDCSIVTMSKSDYCLKSSSERGKKKNQKLSDSLLAQNGIRPLPFGLASKSSMRLTSAPADSARIRRIGRACARLARERLLLKPAPDTLRYAASFDLTWLRSSGRSTLRRRVAARSQIRRNTVFPVIFSGRYLIKARLLYKLNLKINSEWKCHRYTN